MSENIFEQASRLKLRFETTKGLLSVEDLWQLSLQSLDTIAKAVNRKLKEVAEESFIPAPIRTNSASAELQLKLDLLKHVITTLDAETKAKLARSKRQADLAQLRQLAAAKTNEALASQSLEDILKKISELEAETAVSASV
jgi:hypothetical protein